MQLSDTQPEAAVVYAESFETISGADRVARSVEMAEEAKAIALAGIRSRHPEMSAAQVHVEWIRLLHGDSVAAAISPDAV